MSKLVIVESPNKIKSIEKYLGKGYIVKASVGHIVYLPSSGDHRFGVDIKTWEPKYKVDPNKKSVVDDLKAAVKKASDGVVIATDPDREGEAIADNLVEFLKLKEDQYTRARFNEITEDVIKEAINNPTKIDGDLVQSQIARRILDRVIGYKLSGLMRKKIFNSPTSPSAGRVQSIALKLVVEKEREIDAFVPVKYFNIEAKINDKVNATIYMADNENKSWVMPDEIEDVKNKLSGSLTVTDITLSKRQDAKLTPFKQAVLYKKAENAIGISSRSVQSAAQRLYEGYGDGGLISYPRTDSTRLSPVFVAKAKGYLKNRFGDEYVADDIKGAGGAQDAHEAIRPTNPALTPDMARAQFNLSENEFKVYRLIWTHTLQCLMKTPIREIERYDLADGSLEFRMSSSRFVFPGYLQLVGYKDKDPLPRLSKGEVIKVEDYNIEEKQTQPPARYNDGSLIATLDEIKVGRPSTFATTVNILKTRTYVDLEGRTMKPTEFGKAVYEKLEEAFPDIMNIEYTAQLEKQLDEISEGKYDYRMILDEFWEKFEKDVDAATNSLEITRMMAIKAGKDCPVCGNDLVVRRNKKDQTTFFACSNFPQCTHTENDPNSRPRRKFWGKKK